MSLDLFQIADQMYHWFSLNQLEQKAHAACTQQIFESILRDIETYPQHIQDFASRLTIEQLDLNFCCSYIDIDVSSGQVIICICFTFYFVDELIDDDDADYLEKHYQREQVQLREELFTTTPGVLSFLDEEHESLRLINQPSLVNDCRKFAEQIEKQFKDKQVIAKSKEFYPRRLQDKIAKSNEYRTNPDIFVENWPTYSSQDIFIKLSSIGLYIELWSYNERYPYVEWDLIVIDEATKEPQLICDFHTWCTPDGEVDISDFSSHEILIHDPAQPTG